MTIADPAGLLDWRAEDRCLVTLGDAEGVKQRRGTFEDVVRAWIAQR